MFRSSSPLYAQPNLLEGIARSIDFGGTLSEYNVFPYPEMADQIALTWDWTIVGESIHEALEKNPKPKCRSTSGIVCGQE